MIETSLYFTILVPYLLTMVLMPVGVKLFNYLDILDHPNHRKNHDHPVPGTGGIIFFITFIISVVIYMDLSLVLITYFAGVTFLVLVGLIDDIRIISPYNKFFAQVLAAFLFVSITRLHISIPMLESYPSILFILTIIYIVGVTNAINLIDGLDGLAAGVAVIGLGGLSFLLVGSEFLLLTIILCSAIFGFLRANTFPAMIFMGDSGSYFIGYSYAAISLIAIDHSGISFWVPILLLAVPILDMVYVFFRRILNKKNVFMPDRTHIHFRLHDMGISHKNTVFLLYSLQAIITVITVVAIGSLSMTVGITIAILLLLTFQHLILILWQDLNWRKISLSVFYKDIFKRMPFLKNAYIYFFILVLSCLSGYQVLNAPLLIHMDIILTFVALVTAYLFILDKTVGRSANVSIGMILLAGLNIVLGQMGEISAIELRLEMLIWFFLLGGVLLSLPGMFNKHNIFDSPTEFLLIIILLLSTLSEDTIFLSRTGYLLLLLFVVYKILLQSEFVRRYNIIYVVNIITLSAIIIKSLN